MSDVRAGSSREVSRLDNQTVYTPDFGIFRNVVNPFEFGISSWYQVCTNVFLTLFFSTAAPEKFSVSIVPVSPIFVLRHVETNFT